MKRTLILLLLVVWVGPAPASDEEPGSGWTTYTSANGLTVDGVGALAAAPNGDIWCTYLVPGAGVGRFDGHQWESHTEENGLAPGPIVWTGPLAVAPDGTVWVGMFESGLCRYDGESWTTFTTADGLLRDVISTVTVSSEGVVWCGHGVEDGGISGFDGEKWTVFRPADTGGMGEYPILSIATGPNGRLWVGAEGVACYDDKDWHYYRDELAMETPVVMALAVADDGTVWIGGAGVTRFDGTQWRHFSLAEMGVDQGGDHGVTSLALGPNGVLWAGAGELGVYRFDGVYWSRFTEADGLVANSVLAVAVTQDGALWCGTEAGISRYLPPPAGKKR